MVAINTGSIPSEIALLGRILSAQTKAKCAADGFIQNKQYFI